MKYSTDFTKDLDLKWDKNDDYSIFDFEDTKLNFANILAKRLLIHSLASIFNPPGLITPVIVRMKELYQNVCREAFTHLVSRFARNTSMIVDASLSPLASHVK